MKMRVNVNHDGELYAQGSECPKEFEKQFSNKGWLENYQEVDEKKAEEKQKKIEQQKAFEAEERERTEAGRVAGSEDGGESLPVGEGAPVAAKEKPKRKSRAKK